LRSSQSDKCDKSNFHHANINSDLELGNLVNLSLPEFHSNFRSDIIINEESESLRNVNVGNMSYDPSALVESIMNQDDLENN